ncbi:hypothetical protein [Rhodopirellula sp. SWK7]|uniref:hypothetical protein n=1 Tax=Rhodopirellula sp. SWK7 TaxID=595460 RepID=UPI001181AEC4|nr:hypothetical protein [Rhodopirellula sp. SWK7]
MSRGKRISSCGHAPSLVVWLSLIILGWPQFVEADDPWADSTGKFTTQATFVKLVGDDVVLRTPNRDLTVPMERLGANSRARAKRYHKRALEIRELATGEKLTDPPDALKRYDRWQLSFKTLSGVSDLANTLDYFGFQLAALGGKRKGIDYIFDLRFPRPSTSVLRDPSQEKRMYFVLAQRGTLLSGAKELFERTRLDVQGRTLLLVVPEKVEILLANLENQYCTTHGLGGTEDVARCRFMFGKREHPFDVWIDEVTLNGQ